MDISVRITRQENAEYIGVTVDSVVQVPFEQYVAAVVASEIGNALIEACKAQAVAARTFAVFKGVLDGKTISDSSATDQAYRASRFDCSLYPNAVRGTEETENQILTYNGQPISAVYSASNGGSTISSEERWGSARPYLIAQDDPWDDSTIRTGHGVGMSQRGAKAMAKVGKTYREILAFYYPGTEIKTISEGGDTMVTAAQFIEKVLIPFREKWGYIYGTWGSVWTAKKQAAATREMTVKYGSKWIGKMVTDCSGLLRWALYQLGESIVHHARYQYTDYCINKGKLINGHREDGLPVLPGTAVFLKGSEAHIHHVGVYVGNDTVVEAKGTIYGVVTSHLNHWDYWGEIKMVDYTDAAELESGVPGAAEDTEDDAKAGTIIKAIVSNPNKWLNVRSGPGTQYQVAFQVEKGTEVEVLDAGEPDWWQIRYGGRIGWASSQYLIPIKTDSHVEEPVEDDEPAELIYPDGVSFKDMFMLIRASLNALSEEIDKIEMMIDDLKK